jgi:hypothetical protein
MLGASGDAGVKAEVIDGKNNSPSYLTTATAAGTGANWFVAGSTKSPDQGAVAAGTNATQYSLAKATATGYTCGQAGCHLNSVFTQNFWGVTAQRNTGNGMVGATGHRSSPGASSVHIGVNCAPCHPGNPVGGFRYGVAATSAGAASVAAKGTADTARAYGCDQCHDLVGVATGTTAFPHGNRNLDVYEWDASGAATVTAADAAGGNIWMYAGNVAQTGDTNAANTPAPIYDPSFTLITHAVSHGDEPAYINDGVCLKCHVPIDAQSVATIGTGRRAPHHALANPVPTVFSAQNADGKGASTQSIYLWR